MRVWLNTKDPDVRLIEEVELIKENALTIWVRLPDGNVVKRNKARDIVEEK